MEGVQIFFFLESDVFFTQIGWFFFLFALHGAEPYFFFINGGFFSRVKSDDFFITRIFFINTGFFLALSRTVCYK